MVTFCPMMKENTNYNVKKLKDAKNIFQYINSFSKTEKRFERVPFSSASSGVERSCHFSCKKRNFISFSQILYKFTHKLQDLDLSLSAVKEYE